MAGVPTTPKASRRFIVSGAAAILVTIWTGSSLVQYGMTPRNTVMSSGPMGSARASAIRQKPRRSRTLRVETAAGVVAGSVMIMKVSYRSVRHNHPRVDQLTRTAHRGRHRNRPAYSH